ncbi:hypothetical protein B566_EDAN014152 [Ephemera danica]|nr:hypothetical protein B566_EDAN014152 [Ephemera danica]
MEKLTIVYLDKKETLDAQTSQLRQLLKQYNDLVTTLSSTFVQWDQIITDCELAAIPKKRLD